VLKLPAGFFSKKIFLSLVVFKSFVHLQTFLTRSAFLLKGNQQKGQQQANKQLPM